MTTTITNSTHALLTDLERVRQLPIGHPDRTAWRERKADLIDRLELAARELEDQAWREREKLAHPAWCRVQHCRVQAMDDGLVVGAHVATFAARQTVYGQQLRVGMIQDVVSTAHDGGRNGLKVLLALAADESETGDEHTAWVRAEQIKLEPEEARALARHLLEAVTEWEQVSR